MEVKTEQPIDMLHEVKQRADFIFDLGGHAEHVGVVLHEPPNTSETSESTGSLITVNNSEFCHANWKFLVTSVSGVKNEAMTWAIHGFQCPLLFLYIKSEHIVLVVLPVTRGLP